MKSWTIGRKSKKPPGAKNPHLHAKTRHQRINLPLPRPIFATVKVMAKEYATVLIQNGVVYRIDTGAKNATTEATQFDGLKGFPLVAALNKLAELDYAPLHGAIDHGAAHPAGANYTQIFVRDK